jgi:hypothetical protein
MAAVQIITGLNQLQKPRDKMIAFSEDRQQGFSLKILIILFPLENSV